MTVIYLRHMLPYASSHQFRGWRAALALFLGVAPDGVYICPKCHHFGGELLPRLFTLTLRRLFSVALSLRSPSLDVIQHHCSMEPGLSSYAAFRHCYTRLFNLLFSYFKLFYKVCQLIKGTVPKIKFSS